MSDFTEPPMDLELSEMTESQKVSYILRAADVDVIRLADVRRRHQQRKAVTSPYPPFQALPDAG